ADRPGTRATGSTASAAIAKVDEIMTEDRTRARLEALRPKVRPDAQARQLFESQLRLADSQWLAREAIEQHQLACLKALAAFAARSVPFWRERVPLAELEKAPSLKAALSLLPVLSRADVRDNLVLLQVEHLPSGHQLAGERTSSGSTGMVVAVKTT